MKRLVGLVFALPLVATAGNFCAVTGLGSNCNYPTLQACQQALVGIGGQCVVSPAALPSPYPPPVPAAPVIQPMQTPAHSQPSILGVMQHIQEQGEAGRIAGQMQRGYAEGQRMQQERREHADRMRLLEAQEEAARQQANAPSSIARTSPLNRADEFARACRIALAVVEETNTPPNDEVDAALKLGACYGVLVGVDDLHAMATALGQMEPYYCLPASVSREQMVKVIVRKIDQSPESGHLPPAAMAVIALREAWPCSAEQ